MKFFLSAIFGIVCLLLSGFFLTSQFDPKSLPATSADQKNLEGAVSELTVADQSLGPIPPSRTKRKKGEAQSMATASSMQRAVDRDSSLPNASAALPKNDPYTAAADAAAVGRSRTNSAASISTHAPPAALPNVPSGGFPSPHSIEWELAPGVPVPAALVPLGEEKPSPIVAEAQERIADSFVQDLQNVLSDPLTASDDAKVNETYFNSLNDANEQYRALYGEAAYNQKTMQATMEAIGSQ